MAIEYVPAMKVGAEEARKTLPELLERARAGEQTIITRRGVPYAALVPLEQRLMPRRESLTALRGTGRSLWGERAGDWIDDLRNEWA